MQDIRCDYYSDHYLEGEVISNGLLKINIVSDNNKSSSVLLSKESAKELIKELIYELENIKAINKSPY